MAARPWTTTCLFRLCYLAVFSLAANLILVKLLAKPDHRPPRSEQVTPDTSLIHGECLPKNSTHPPPPTGLHGSPPGVAIVTWSLTDYAVELRRSLTSPGHVIVLCLAGVARCRRSAPADVELATTDCRQSDVDAILSPLGVHEAHFVYDADQAVSMARMTSPITGRLFHCHTVALEALLKASGPKKTLYFHFVRAGHVDLGVSDRDDSDRDVSSQASSCSITLDHRDRHALFVKLLEMIIDTYRGLYDFNYYFVV